jgi:hypothetical protein
MNSKHSSPVERGGLQAAAVDGQGVAAKEALPDHWAEVTEEAGDASRPRVISVAPVDGAEGVAGVTELREPFHQSARRQRWLDESALAQTGTGGALSAMD